MSLLFAFAIISVQKKCILRIKKIFILREWDRDGERIINKLCAASAKPYVGLDLTNCKIMK